MKILLGINDHLLAFSTRPGAPQPDEVRDFLYHVQGYRVCEGVPLHKAVSVIAKQRGTPPGVVRMAELALLHAVLADPDTTTLEEHEKYHFALTMTQRHKALHNAMEIVSAGTRQ